MGKCDIWVVSLYAYAMYFLWGVYSHIPLTFSHPAAEAPCAAGVAAAPSTTEGWLRCSPKGNNYDMYSWQGGHFQTHFEGHFQTQTTVNSVLTARDSISGPRKPRVISKHDQGVISNTLTKPWGHFQTQAYFLLPGTAFSGLSISFHVAPTHTFRLRLGGGLGFRVGTGVGEALDIDKATL